MIDKISYEIVRHLATNVNFFDKWAGLVKPMRKMVQKTEKVFPVAINTPSNCDPSDYTALVPDNSKRSIAYIEMIQPPDVEVLRHNSKQMTAKLRLVVWYNLDLITSGAYVTEDSLVDQVLDWMPKRLSDSLFVGAMQVHIGVDGITYGTDIVSQYTYQEVKTQFGIHPYGMFGVDLDVWYIATHCQDQIGNTIGCETGKGNHETATLADLPIVPLPDDDVVATIAFKADPIGTDVLFIQDSADNDEWKKVLVSDIEGIVGPPGVDGVDGINGTNGIDGVDGNQLVGINPQTGTTYTLALADAGKLIRQSNANPITTTVPKNSVVAIPVNSVITLEQQGAGQITLTPVDADVILNAFGGMKSAGQYAGLTLVKVDTNVWTIFGGIA